MVKQKKEKTIRPESPINEPYSEYSVVEQLHKQPACVLVLALLLSSEAHRSALMKALNETYVTDGISINNLDRLVLHITTRCKGYTLPGVLADNGLTLNILPLSTLNRLPVDNSHMKTCQNIVRAFDGTERRVMGRIEIPLQIGPNTYEVDFLIHSVGAVPSSLHQKLKLVTEGRLVTINAEEDIIAFVTSNAPYIGADDEAIECSFQSLEFVNTTFVVEGNKIPMPKISKSTRMGLQITVGKGALPGKGLRKCLQGKIERKSKREEGHICTMRILSINTVSEEGTEERSLSRICPYTPGSVLNNWTMEEIPVTFRINSESSDINDMSDAVINLESPFEKDMCMKDSQDFENN
ncbi:hypothetical protein EPI10_016358 [Gossypium australe]|uniref:Uncharacterized protein n=1 Tax=Gossypium australe TaxID=47621 RepID=A0A5B6VMY1_9ROSI|nr:hypothetical protein EPI10_016358 [Gossypium australe]